MYFLVFYLFCIFFMKQKLHLKSDNIHNIFKKVEDSKFRNKSLEITQQFTQWKMHDRAYLGPMKFHWGNCVNFFHFVSTIFIFILFLRLSTAVVICQLDAQNDNYMYMYCKSCQMMVAQIQNTFLRSQTADFTLCTLPSLINLHSISIFHRKFLWQ